MRPLLEAELIKLRTTRTFIALAGVATLAGPWLAHAPVVHGVLAALGCRTLA